MPRTFDKALPLPSLSLSFCLSLSRSAFSYRHTDDRTSFWCKHPSRGYEDGRNSSIDLHVSRTFDRIRKVMPIFPIRLNYSVIPSYITVLLYIYIYVFSRYFAKIFLIVSTFVIYSYIYCTVIYINFYLNLCFFFFFISYFSFKQIRNKDYAITFHAL